MNTMKITLLCLMGLSACSTPPKPASRPPNPIPKVQVRQVYLKPGDLKRVRTDEFVKTYHIGRTVRGRAGDTLHEAHRVYRLEKPSRWNLARDQPPLASTGPVKLIVDSAFKPAPESKALRAELRHQREVSEQLERSRRELENALVKVRAHLTESSDSAEIVQSVTAQLKRLQAEVAASGKNKGTTEVPESEATELPASALRKWGEELEGQAP